MGKFSKSSARNSVTRGAIIYQACHNTTDWGLKQQKLILSQFWRLEVQD